MFQDVDLSMGCFNHLFAFRWALAFGPHLYFLHWHFGGCFSDHKFVLFFAEVFLPDDIGVRPAPLAFHIDYLSRQSLLHFYNKTLNLKITLEDKSTSDQGEFGVLSLDAQAEDHFIVLPLLVGQFEFLLLPPEGHLRKSYHLGEDLYLDDIVVGVFEP
jgi:hypothetical protein